MAIDAVVQDVLLSFAPVAALVGSRVYTKVLPQTVTLPAVRVARISEVEDIHLRGPVNLRRARVQVDAVALTGAAVSALDDAIHGDGIVTGLRVFRGTVGAVRISLMEPAGAREDYTGEELKQYRIMRDYMVTWSPIA